MKAARWMMVVSLVVLFSSPVGAAQYKMRISHQMPETHFLAGEVKEFKNLVEQKTGGKLAVEIYPAAQAFKPKETMNAVATGAIEAAVTTNFEWSGIIPAMDIFLVPFLVTDIPVIDQAISGEVGAALFKKMETKGVAPVMWMLQTRTNIYTSKAKPLVMPADFKGQKIRGTSKIMNLGSEALGAAAVPISGPEVHTALERGTIDIGLTGVDAALTRHYYEFHKYGTVSNNFTVIHVLFVNPTFFKSLPADVQGAVRESALAVQKKSLQDSENFKDTSVAELKKKMTIHMQTKPEEQAWRAVMEKPVLDHFLQITGKEGAELVELMSKIKR
ncbi:MAG: TRAP transporter substrate-binding protein DctP [Thermodesulfobacteriota bacterium]